MPGEQFSRMTTTHPGWHVLGVVFALLLLPPASHSEIYKWVDANGQTQYGDRKPTAANAKAVDVNVQAAPKAPPSNSSPTESGRPVSIFDTPKPVADAPTGPQVNRRKLRSDGKDHGTDESRCALARDVLDGGLMYRNGNRIDPYAREVAQNDIKMFCR